MKHLKKKDSYVYIKPTPKILDTFENPGVDQVQLTCHEFTSLCPITGQPDYSEIEITYWPGELCLESKSLKLYLGAYRMQGSFTETLAANIRKDMQKTLHCRVAVTVHTKSRGGISISGRSYYDN